MIEDRKRPNQQKGHNHQTCTECSKCITRKDKSMVFLNRNVNVSWTCLGEGTKASQDP